jgi:hypothetical protein
VQVIEDRAAGHGEHRDHAGREQHRVQAGAVAIPRRHGPGQRQEDRHHARRISDHEQRDEDLAEQFDIHTGLIARG